MQKIVMQFAHTASEAFRFRLIRNARYALALALLCAACSPTRGCAESDFDLAPASRLPKWFTLPPGISRSDVSVKMTYYISLFADQRRANFVLRDSRGRKLAEVEGEQRGARPFTLTPAPPTGPFQYPGYEIVTVNGIIEVIEHRRFEGLFYITDDPKVRAKLGVAQ